MNDPYIPMKKPHGCWKWSGCMLTIVSRMLEVVWLYADDCQCVADCLFCVDDRL